MSDPDYKPQAWRMAGYYPGQYAKSMAALGIGIDYSDDDHDRYEAQFLADLAEHDAAVKREAAAGALEEAARLIRPPITIEDMYSAAGVNMPAHASVVGGNRALHRVADDLDQMARTTRNPRTPGEETTP